MSKSTFSDPKFVERLRKHDQAAWEEILDVYLPQLLRAGRGMGFSPADSEDLAHSAFTALMNAIGRFEGRSDIRTFLFGIFYNKVSEHLKEKRKAEESDPIDEVLESRFNPLGGWRQPPLDIHAKIFAREVRQILQRCLGLLPRSQRIAFYLREVEEMKTSEICEKMEVTATNLAVLLFRARNRLRQCVEKEGLERK